MREVRFLFQVITFSKILDTKTCYIVTGAVRVDGSSVFGEDQRNQKYYKASGSYVISEHEFWKNSVHK